MDKTYIEYKNIYSRIFPSAFMWTLLSSVIFEVTVSARLSYFCLVKINMRPVFFIILKKKSLKPSI